MVAEEDGEFKISISKHLAWGQLSSILGWKQVGSVTKFFVRPFKFEAFDLTNCICDPLRSHTGMQKIPPASQRKTPLHVKKEKDRLG